MKTTKKQRVYWRDLPHYLLGNMSNLLDDFAELEAELERTKSELKLANISFHGIDGALKLCNASNIELESELETAKAALAAANAVIKSLEPREIEFISSTSSSSIGEHSPAATESQGDKK